MLKYYVVYHAKRSGEYPLDLEDATDVDLMKSPESREDITGVEDQIRGKYLNLLAFAKITILNIIPYSALKQHENSKLL